MKTKRFLTGCLLAGTGLVGALAAGCGGGGSGGGVTTPTPVAAPTPAPAPQVIQQNSGRVPARTAVLLPTFSLSQSGTVEITADWTFARNDIDVLLARGVCTIEQARADRCEIIGSTSSTTAKPERLRLSVPAGSYTPLIANFSEEDEAVSYQVVFTPGAVAALSAPAASAPVSLDRLRELTFLKLQH